MRRQIAGEIARGGAEAARQAERLGQPGQRRPDGPLIWLHASGPAQEAPLVDLARRIGEAHPEASFLMTTDMPLLRDGPLPPRMVHQYVPNEASGPVASFVAHWRPDVVLWAGTALRPALIHAAASAGADMHLLDASGAPEAVRGWRGWGGLARATLGAFRGVLATDELAAEALRNAGAEPRSVVAAGPLEAETPALPCDPHERDALGALLTARPLWMAVSVAADEVADVLAAQSSVQRLAHRLLLVLVPTVPAQGPAIAQRLAEDGHSVALRSEGEDPAPGSDVVVADVEGELGLWYRLAPVTLMASTLAPGGGGGRSPLEPAALGSAILHGPNVGPHAGAYARFREAGAALEVTQASLADTLSELLAPDRAAELAHAAWRVSTGGADTSDRILALVGEALSRRTPR